MKKTSLNLNRKYAGLKRPLGLLTVGMFGITLLRRHRG